MIDNEFLAGAYDMIPGVIKVTLYPWKNGQASEDGVVVEVAEKRPVELQEESIFQAVEIEVDRAVFHLWVPHIQWTSAVPRQKVNSRWVIQESNGDRWSVVRAGLEMLGTRWRCHCVQNFQKRTA